MKAGEARTVDERYTSLLAVCEAALAAGSTLDEIEVPAELAEDLKRDLACVGLLRQVLPACGEAFVAAGADSDVDLEPPLDRLGHFEIRRELGRGSFGIVYLAYETRLGREVALKIPRINALADPELRKRFQREAQTAAGLNHPNLVAVYEADQVGPVCFIASEYCPGVSLAKWLKACDQPIPFHVAADLIARLADAMHYAHTQGVVHRDLKPANVLLAMERETFKAESETPEAEALSTFDFSLCTPKITDFGLARFFQSEAELTQTGTGALLGTPSYMAPEQAVGKTKEVGPVADIYALGAMLYELLTGRPPFQADAVVDTLLMVRTDEP